MNWPSTHTCHHGAPSVASAPFGSWRPPTTGYEDVKYSRYFPWRSCDYCGSIHPEDVLTIAETYPIRVELADRKYGWPHKVYIDIKHTFEPEREFEIGTNFDGTPIVRKGQTFTVKFYNEHLADDGITDEQFSKITDWVLLHTRYHFTRKDGKLFHHFCPVKPEGAS